MNPPQIYLGILIFFLGAALGSFFSVIIYRIHHKKRGILFGRSFCPNCKKNLKWHQLIPVFSYLFSGGKCKHGKEKIPLFYFAIELFTGILFLFIYIKFPLINDISQNLEVFSPEGNFYKEVSLFEIKNLKFFIFYALIFSFLSLIFFYDYKYQEIPDRFSLPAIIIAFSGNLILNNLEISNILIGGLVIGGFFLVQFLVSRGKWVGGGDIRLGVLMGFLLGWKLGLIALILSYFIGSIFSIFLIITKKLNRKSTIAFGPFLIIGTIISLFYGQEILNWYQNFLYI